MRFFLLFSLIALYLKTIKSEPEDNYENAKEIYDFFIEKNWTVNAITGLLGNIYFESNCNPYYSNDKKNRYGLVQWSSESLMDWAEENGLNYSTINTQCQRIQWELENNEIYIQNNCSFENFFEYSQSNDSAEHLAECFMREYKRPSESETHLEYRQNCAKYWFYYFSDDSPLIFTYQVRNNGEKSEEIQSDKFRSYAEIIGTNIIDVAIKVNRGTVHYKVHRVDNDWLPSVTGYNWNDFDNGYAGDNTEIDKIQIYYNDEEEFEQPYYRVAGVNGNYSEWQYGSINEIKGYKGYAGIEGVEIYRLQIIPCKKVDENNYKFLKDNEFKCISPNDEYTDFNNRNYTEKFCMKPPEIYSTSSIYESYYSNIITNENSYKLLTNENNNNVIIRNSDIEIITKGDNIKYLINIFYKSYLDNGNDIEIEKGYFKYTMTSTQNQRKNENKKTTVINLGKCEIKLKEIYRIPENETLYITKVDIREEGMKIPKIEYEVYYYQKFNKTLSKLDLTHCQGIKIDIFIPVHLNDSLNKYNQSSDFYNDVCSKTTSESGTDISLSDRKKNFIDNNMTLCEEDCNLDDYNHETEIAKCSCLVKINMPLLDDIKFDKDKLYKQFTDINNIMNLKFLKCYKSVLKWKELKNNYGFYIFVIINILYLLTAILFYSKFYFLLKQDIKKIEKAKSFLMKKNDKNNNNHNNITQKKNKHKRKININYPPKQKSKKSVNLNDYINTQNKIEFNKNNKNKKKKPKRKRKIHCEKNKFIEDNIFKTYIEILKPNDNEKNLLKYKEAISNDKRTFLQYYFSLLKLNHLFIFSFYCTTNDYNSQIIKIFLFFFFFSVHFTINALFFNDKTMHEIYIDKGSYDFIYQISQIIYSSLISTVIDILIKYLALSEDDIVKIKEEKKLKDIHLGFMGLYKSLNIKFALFFMVSFCLLFIFSFYITCFCGIYENTQIHLIKDTVISFGLSLIYPFGIYLFPGIFRILALKDIKQNKECFYNVSQFLQKL